MNTIERLEWDSSFFGFAVGRVKETVTARQMGDVVCEADSSDLVCIYLLVAADDTALLDSAQRQGFVVRDVRVELERPVAGHIASMAGVRRAHSADAKRLEPLARTRFQASRFFSDDGFDNARVEDMYAAWLARGLREDDGWVTLVTLDELGFIVCELRKPTCEGLISLIAVAPEVEGRGIGGSLVEGAGKIFAESSMRTAKVITQGSNIAAQRLYHAHGYRTTRVSFWLHWWRAGQRAYVNRRCPAVHHTKLAIPP